MILERFRHRKSITYKQAVAIVIGLHVAGFIGLSEFSKLRASWRKADRDKMFAQKADEPKVSSWPENRPAPVVVARPKPKKEVVVPPSIPEKISDGVVSGVNNTKALYNYLTDTCQDIATVTQNSAKALQQATKQTSSLIENKLQASQYRNPKPLPTPCRKPLSISQSTPKPTPRVIYSKTTRYSANQATKEEYIETRTIIPQTNMQQHVEDIAQDGYYLIVRDRRTGEWKRAQVVQ